MNKETHDVFAANFSSNLVREEEMDGVKYLVVPTVLIVEGVVNNVLYTRDELKKFPAAWNGRPVPVYHPLDDKGQPISANSPQELSSRNVGQIFNVKYSLGKLKGEAWIIEDKLNKISPDTLNLLKNNSPVEVSTGLFYELEAKEGEFNSKPYKGVVHNIRPDHLAILPGQVGACSWDDGAGMPRINTKIGGGEVSKGLREILDGLKEYAGKLFTNAKSNRDIENELKAAIGARESSEDVYILDVFPHEVIYEIWNNLPVGNNRKLYRTKYKKNGVDGAVELEGVSEEVFIETSYKPVINSSQEVGGGSSSEGVVNNNEGEDSMDRKSKVDGLIKLGSAVEEDRVHLMALNDASFEKLFPNEPEKPEEKPEEKPAVNKPAEVVVIPVADGVKESQPKTVEDFIANAPGEIRESLQRMVRLDKDHRGALVAAIAANKRNSFSNEELAVMPLETLEKLSQMASDVRYDGRGTGEPRPAINSPAKIAPMGLPQEAAKK